MSFFKAASNYFSGFVAATVVIAALLIFKAPGVLSVLFSKATPIQDQPIETDRRPVVAQQIQGVTELTTAKFHGEVVVPMSQSRNLWSINVGSINLIYAVSGDVTAGLDLSRIQPDDITLDETTRTITVRVPPPKILSSSVNPERSRALQYSRDITAPDVAPQLQDEAMQEGSRQILEAACQSGILKDAETRGKQALIALLKISGWDNVVVESTGRTIDCGQGAIEESPSPVPSESVEPPNTEETPPSFLEPPPTN